jgi:glycerol-3-phosphate dehydrogenase
VVSVVGVKYTTGRGVAQRAVDIVCAQLDRGKGECRTATRLLPGAVEDPEALVSDAGRVWTGRIAPDAVRQVVATCGAHYEQVLRRTEDCPELSQTIAQSSVVRAQVVHAVREEMACRLIDVIARRTPLGSAAYPGDEAVEACAALMRDELCWSDTRVAEEIAATRAFYLPVRIA